MSEEIENSQIESSQEQKSVHGAHAKEGQSAYIHKSTRMRRVLIVVIIVLIALVCALGILLFQLYQSAKDAAVQQVQLTQEESALNTETGVDDTDAMVTKKTTVPNLVSLLGMTQEAAIQSLAHGAQVTSTIPVNEEGNPIRAEVKVALTTEPSDTRSGAPTVFLSLDEAGVVLQAGYSTSTSSLGYGSLSFADAIQNEHIVEKTLQEAGIQVEAGTVALPEDKMVYSSYASDGTTLTKENCSFDGVGTANGVEHAWSAVLSYDYTMANATGNLADTIRTIFIYIG